MAGKDAIRLAGVLAVGMEAGLGYNATKVGIQRSGVRICG